MFGLGGSTVYEVWVGPPAGGEGLIQSYTYIKWFVTERKNNTVISSSNQMNPSCGTEVGTTPLMIFT